MRYMAWHRALWLSLGVMAVSTALNLWVSGFVRTPSVAFDVRVTAIDTLVVLGAAVWYFRGTPGSAGKGLVLGLVLLGLQLALGVVLGVTYVLLHMHPLPVSAQPITMFIVNSVLTLGITSYAGALRSVI